MCQCGSFKPEDISDELIKPLLSPVSPRSGRGTNVIEVDQVTPATHVVSEVLDESIFGAEMDQMSAPSGSPYSRILLKAPIHTTCQLYKYEGFHEFYEKAGHLYPEIEVFFHIVFLFTSSSDFSMTRNFRVIE